MASLTWARIKAARLWNHRGQRHVKTSARVSQTLLQPGGLEAANALNTAWEKQDLRTRKPMTVPSLAEATQPILRALVPALRGE